MCSKGLETFAKGSTMNELENRLSEVSTDTWGSLRERLLEEAAGQDLLDLAYERHDSPFGTLLVVAGPRGILRIALATEDEAEVLHDLAARVSPRIGRVGQSAIATARTQLDRYFDGRLRDFELPLDWQLTRGFRREVLKQTVAIPYGSTASYAEVANQAGNPRAVRAAGSALATNPLPIIIPCHRILRSDGTTGSYLGGSRMKEALLALEQGGAD